MSTTLYIDAKCKQCGRKITSLAKHGLCYICQRKAEAEACKNKPDNTGAGRTKRVSCKICGRMFTTSSDYDACMKCRKLTPPHDQVCELCGKVFQTKGSATICPSCRQRRYHKTANLTAKRKCHDCGKPTPDYRCQSCWAALRKRLGLGATADNYEEDC